MRVIVVSDSHGELENIKLLSLVAKEEKVEKIIHLGDDYDDADLLMNEGITIERVPGVFSAYYTERDIPNRKVIELEGWKLLLTHTKERHQNDLTGDTPPEEYIRSATVDIMLYGHTHIPAISIENHVYLINPGHLKSSDKRGYEPSYAVMDISSESIQIIVKALHSRRILLKEIITHHSK
jgi:putative phosphoesterase